MNWKQKLRSLVPLGAALAWEASPHWTVQAAVESGVFTNDVGINRAGRVSATLGVRYGHF